MPSAIRRRPDSITAWSSSRSQRAVPFSVTRAVIWFCASPPSTTVTLTTPPFSGSRLRATIDCTATMACPAATIGSRVRCGSAAWPAWPSKTISKRAPAAITARSCTAMVPTGRPGQLCQPKMRSIGKRVNSPSAIMARAPPPPSSAGWNTRRTVPVQLGSSSSSFAAPSSAVVCPSCPQACITPGTVDFQGRSSVCSWMGSASMSPRSPTARFPPPRLIVATTPCPPTFSAMSVTPISRRRATTKAAVSPS